MVRAPIRSLLTSATMAVVASETLLKSLLLRHFPFREANFVFAYGSAVFAQGGGFGKGKMVDVIFVVDDAARWHEENLKRNSSHYSAMKWAGANNIARMQDNFASGVYYNPFVKVEDQVLKYGVMSRGVLERDLREWTHFYVAGRLQKPVMVLQGPSSDSLAHALNQNRLAALRAALLQEDRIVSKFHLYHTITELSYLGDSRMKVAETPEKTKNIVGPLMNHFDRVYLPLLHQMDHQVDMDEKGFFVQDVSPAARFKLLMGLPHRVQLKLARQLLREPKLYDIEETMAELSYLMCIRTSVRLAISEVVFTSSVRQTVQGVLSAGVWKSVKYAWEKLQKGALRPQRSRPLNSS